MSDVDDELLALAGGDSDDEASGNESRGGSPSPPPAKRSGSKKGAGKKSRRGNDDSEEEGEASAPGTPNSLESAPMDESDSDDEPSRGRAAAAEDDDEAYPIDGRYKSQKEKAEIMALPELEREQLIAERMTDIERQRQNRLLRQMVSNMENEERKQVKKKRSAGTAELEDGDRKASRPRTESKRETAMDSLRQAKAEKAHATLGQRTVTMTIIADAPPTPDADENRDQPPAELRDYERVRLGRNEFAQVCFTPGFEQAITGCYIRIALGPHPESGIEQYRMAAIKGFTTSRPYALQGPNGAFVTDQYVKAAHGKAIKEFPFIAASSGKFTENELNRYKVTCHNEGVTLPSKAYLMDKIDEINGLINHSWTTEEIKRERIAHLLEEARQRGEHDKAEELQEELDNLGSQRLAFRTSLGSSKHNEVPKAQTEQDRLAERNRENRRLNAEAVRKAQLKEKAKSKEIEAALKRGETYQGDMSRRLRTKAKFVYDANEKVEQKPAANGSGTNTPGTSTPKAAAKSQLLPHLAKLQEEKHKEKGIPTIHKPLMDDDVIGSLDLDIDVEI
ncbi:hypothetical protein RAB80_003112 [Fusarium oxysporum f. sp. vasinfectum]|nr:hypothetical protein RAB80_003112 [Fusarium oxysporum f. sp. vasinfectum]